MGSRFVREMSRLQTHRIKPQFEQDAGAFEQDFKPTGSNHNLSMHEDHVY